MNNGVLRTGEGRTIWVVGDRYTIKARGEDTCQEEAKVVSVRYGTTRPTESHDKPRSQFAGDFYGGSLALEGRVPLDSRSG